MAQRLYVSEYVVLAIDIYNCGHTVLVGCERLIIDIHYTYVVK